MIIETSDTDDARLFYDVSENHFVAGQGAALQEWRGLGFLTTPISLLHRLLHGCRGTWARIVRYTGSCVYTLIATPLSSVQLNSPLNAFACVTVHIFSNLLTPLRRPEAWAFARGRNKLGHVLRFARVVLHVWTARVIL